MYYGGVRCLSENGVWCTMWVRCWSEKGVWCTMGGEVFE